MTTVSPKLRPWLNKMNRATSIYRTGDSSGTDYGDPATVREAMANMTSALVTDQPELPWVGDSLVHTGGHPVPVRIYDPLPEVKKPVCLFFHGGGHVSGSVAVYDAICRKLALASKSLVVSAEYRLAPEYPYPLGLADCLGVARHIWPALTETGRGFQKRLFLAGDSGGGAFAASISARAQDDAHLNIEKQVLIYPSLDYTLAQPSVTKSGRGYLLEKAQIHWYFDQYFQQKEDRRALSPLYMPVSARLPETLLVTAGLCPLHDEGMAYLKRLDEVGATYRHLHLPDMIHAFLNLEDLVVDECARTYREIGRFLSG